VVEKEWLDILGSLAAGIAVADMSDGHTTRELLHLLFVEDFAYKSVTFNPVKFSRRAHCDYTASLLASVLECVQAIICKTCSIIHAIDSKNTTLMV
jgi:hypothetical protein